MSVIPRGDRDGSRFFKLGRDPAGNAQVEVRGRKFQATTRSVFIRTQRNLCEDWQSRSARPGGLDRCQSAGQIFLRTSDVHFPP